MHLASPPDQEIYKHRLALNQGKLATDHQKNIPWRMYQKQLLAMTADSLKTVLFSGEVQRFFDLPHCILCRQL